MTDATRSAIIKEKPIAHGLDAFRDSAHSLLQDLDVSGSTTMLDQIDDESKDFGYWIFHAGLLTEIGIQNHALQLLVALQNLPASYSLPSGAGGKNLFNDCSGSISQSAAATSTYDALYPSSQQSSIISLISMSGRKSMNFLRSRQPQLMPNRRHHPHPILHIPRPSNRHRGHSTRVASRTHRT